jgi:hypothetical protein
MKIRNLDCNLKFFKEEFIGAGPRTSVIGLYKDLVAMGAEQLHPVTDADLINSGKQIVILCVNDGVNSKFGRVSLHPRTWWDFYHNKKKRWTKPTYRTYNIPKQYETIIKLLNVRKYELIFPD